MFFWICYKVYIYFICYLLMCLEWLYMDWVFMVKCYWVMYKVFDIVIKVLIRFGNNDDWIYFVGV